jgi:hypothetical protein
VGVGGLKKMVFVTHATFDWYYEISVTASIIYNKWVAQ